MKTSKNNLHQSLPQQDQRLDNVNAISESGRGAGFFVSLGLCILALFIGLIAGVLSGQHASKESRLSDNEKNEINTPVAFIPEVRLHDGPVRVTAQAFRNRDVRINFALMRSGAVASGGVRPELLIDGQSSDYDGVKGFAYTNWAKKVPPSFVVTLKKSVPLNSVRFLLWDVDHRFFRYNLEVSSEATGMRWNSIANFTGEHHKRSGWQNIFFETQQVRRIRLTGTYNSESNGFQVIELQAFKLSKSIRTTVSDMEF